MEIDVPIERHTVRKPLLVAAATLLALSVTTPAFAADTDCGDYRFQEDAQAVYDEDTSDPNGLDGPIGSASSGVPGVACENRPSRGTTPGTGSTEDSTSSSGGESQMEQTPQGGSNSGGGSTTGIENAGLIGTGGIALLGGATLLARRRFASDN